MIQLVSVSKTFSEGTKQNVHAVRDVSLTINDGEIFGIVGFSGAGKSTLVRCVNLLERPTSGDVLIDHQNLTQMRPNELRKARKKIGMIFQHFNLMKSRNVYQNVAYPLKGSGLTQEETKRKVMALLEIVGLSDKVKAYPAQLSGGQKQRVAIARALANDPNVLLCDEATSALDPQTTQDILKLLRELNETLGITILLITHEMAVVKEICTRMAVMEDGYLVEEGEVYQIFSNPKEEITKKFIRTAMNSDKIENLLLNDPMVLNVAPDDMVLRLEFTGGSAKEALVSSVSRKYKIDLSIIFGNVDMIGGRPLGLMVVVLRGDEENVRGAIEYMRQQQVMVEIMRHGSDINNQGVGSNA